MNENKTSDYMLFVMKNLNFIIILYISVVMSASLSGVLQEQSALTFLNQAGMVPITPWKIPMIALYLYISCLLLMFMKHIGNGALFLRVCLEIVIGFLISYVLGFSYTGIIFLILADAMKHFPKSKWRFPVAIIIALFYILIDYSILNVWLDIVPLETYIEYYQNDVRSVLLGVKNMAASLNTFLFLLYMILLVRIQMSEKEKILKLNKQLNVVNEELSKANMQLEKYAKEAEIMVQTRERNRLAREIHDTLGHALTGIITGLEACIALMDVAPEATKEQLRAIAEVARRGITDVRRSVKALRPDALEKLGLKEALENTVKEMRSASNAEIIYHCTAGLGCFSKDEEDIIYRIVQESITNSIRHGKAGRIQIDISREYNMLKIEIRDNGIGCSDIKKGFGLHHMEERLALLQGQLSYSGENGFTIEAQIPIRWGTEEKDD